MAEFEVPVPPLAEQQRIVGLLEEAFAGIATAQANAEKNLQNARTLFASHLQSVFTQRGKGWVGKTLEEISTTFGRGKSKQQKEIVATLDALREEIQRLASLYERKLAALEALKKSLLRQAFSGNL